MKVEIHRNETSQPIVYSDVQNTYTKGNMYCVLLEDKKGNRTVHKYPMCTLFRVTEDYAHTKSA